MVLTKAFSSLKGVTGARKQPPASLSSVQFSRSVMSDSLRPHGLQHASFPVHHQLPELTQTRVH